MFTEDMSQTRAIIKLGNWNDHHSGKTSPYLFDSRSKSFA